MCFLKFWIWSIASCFPVWWNATLPSQRSLPVLAAAVRSDQLGKPTLPKARAAFPSRLRRVGYFDAETERTLIFLTHQLEIPALTVARLYRLRWRIEWFFRWIKGHLRSTTTERVPTR